VLRRDLAQLLERYYNQPLSAIAFGPLLTEMLSTMRRHQLILPSNLSLLLKTTAMSEGMGEQLDPSFNLTDVLTPYAEKFMLQQNSPVAWARRFGKAGIDLAWLAVELPQQLRRLLGELDRGALKIDIQPTGLDPLLKRAERIANRIVLGVIVAAFIVGLAMLMSAYHPGDSGLLQVILTIGFALAGVLALYLIWSIFRSGHH
jgi:ubiquinone biosynthesis protein